MNERIEIEYREPFGEPRFYPANDQAMCLAEIVGTKTLTVQTLRLASTMGFAIVLVDSGRMSQAAESMLRRIRS